MQIVFNRNVAEELSIRYTVVELETFDVEGKLLETFCVIPVEKLAFMDLSKLGEQIVKHNDFLSLLKAKEWGSLVDIYTTVHGSFGGELDSFYDEIMSRADLHIEGLK